jgi:hypothetical protein
VSANEVLAQRLETFLAKRRVTREMLLASVSEPFGPPLLVVATGSILHGVGNERSDLDVNVVVEHEVSRFPVASFTGSVLVDVTYFSASDVSNWVSTIRDSPWPPAGGFGREEWRRRLDQLLNSTRFGYGVTLIAREGWTRWSDEFHQQWLTAKVVQWWRIEMVRRQVASRWLMGAKPLLAAHCQHEAVLAALESHAATSGHLYFGAKWLPEKLRAMGDEAALEALRAAMRAPKVEAEVTRYMAQCQGILNEYGSRCDDDLVAQLSYLPGVKVRKLNGQTLVSRWDMRGIELGEAATFSRSKPSGVLWEGEVRSLPPSDVLELFIEDMTWLSIVRAEK